MAIQTMMSATLLAALTYDVPAVPTDNWLVRARPAMVVKFQQYFRREAVQYLVYS
jgi:hypothetical protein